MPFGPFVLQWRAPSPNPPTPTPLPEGITRSTVPTPSGPLELLCALPAKSSDPSLPPIFFAHGGFGCAEVWANWMLYFSSRGYPCYAVSYRGHGKSWYPGFLRMVWTTRGTMAKDLVAGIEFVEALERERREEQDVKVVLVAHSAGAALSQYVLSRGLAKVQGFVMCAAVPGFGSADCYSFWAPMAPFHFPYRAFHPRYPLANTMQIKAAFFAPETPVSYARHLERLLAPYESLLWPIQCIFRFVTGPDVLESILGWRRTRTETADEGFVTERLLVLAGEKDVVCKPSLLFDAARRYQAAFRKSFLGGKIEGLDRTAIEKEHETGVGGSGVQYSVALGVGHHMQNEAEWERGAEKILRWVQRL